VYQVEADQALAEAILACQPRMPALHASLACQPPDMPRGDWQELSAGKRGSLWTCMAQWQGSHVVQKQRFAVYLGCVL